MRNRNNTHWIKIAHHYGVAADPFPEVMENTECAIWLKGDSVMAVHKSGRRDFGIVAMRFPDSPHFLSIDFPNLLTFDSGYTIGGMSGKFDIVSGAGADSGDDIRLAA